MFANRARTTLIVACLFAVAALAVCTIAASHRPDTLFANSKTPSEQLTLPSGWRIRPAGKTISLPGDMPLKFAFTPDGKYLLVNTAGHHDHSINLIDLSTNNLKETFKVWKNWAGLAINPAGDRIYLSGGGSVENYPDRLKDRGLPITTAEELSKPVLTFTLQNGKLTPTTGIIPEGIDLKKRYISGITYGTDESLYVLDINADMVYRIHQNGKVAASAKVGYRPYSAALSPDQKTLAISNWGDKSVSLLDPITLQQRNKITVGSQPSELVYGKDGRLYVANGGANSVSVIYDGAVRETITTSLEPNAPIGTMPTAVAISPDNKRLYVANAGNNDVAVVDISRFDHTTRNSRSQVLGFIPTGWYPSALAVSPNNKKLYIGVGKGMYFRGNPSKSNDPSNHDYIGDVLNGAVCVVDVPDTKQLATYTKTVRENLPVPPKSVVTGQQMADATAAFRKIKHVLFIIKENRTYDQVFGDIPGGNGDPKLVMYGEKVTPNHHELAKRTVLLDNLYCSGEVSEDGHEWCNSAYATDFKQKGWVNSYSERGEPEADERLSDSPAGYLWDNCKAHGLSYRTYGEYSSFKSSPTSRPIFTGNPRLKDHASQEWWEMDARTDARDADYAGIFVNDLKKAERTGEWPRYIVMSLGEDHTNGLRAGAFSPNSCVAANDQGVGVIVDALSHSRFWKETAIFIIEDDAQDGPDHVDAHRTIGLVISPYVKRHFVDSTLYTTNSMIRTMELILGLPSMTQFDAKATPMYNSFTSVADLTPYTLIAPQIDLTVRNPAAGNGAKQSAMLDFSAHDRADPVALNRILWEASHPGVPMPAPVRSSVSIR